VIEVGVEHRDLSDLNHREMVELGCLTDGVLVRPVVDTERGLLVGGDIGVDPGDTTRALFFTIERFASAPVSLAGRARPPGKLR
jgi:hypothetical protein